MRQPVAVRVALIAGICGTFAAVVPAAISYFSKGVSETPKGDTTITNTANANGEKSSAIVNNNIYMAAAEQQTRSAEILYNPIIYELNSHIYRDVHCNDYANNQMIDMLSDRIKQDNNDITAYVLRGLAFQMQGSASGGCELDKALSDFREAEIIDNNTADANFGKGTVLYYFAMLDIVRRHLYYIQTRGDIKSNEKTGLFTITNPIFEIYVDGNVKTILNGALSEFQSGLLKKDAETNKGTLLPFGDMVKRLRTVRELLGLETSSNDHELPMQLELFAVKIDPKEGGVFFNPPSK